MSRKTYLNLITSKLYLFFETRFRWRYSLQRHIPFYQFNAKFWKITMCVLETSRRIIEWCNKSSWSFKGQRSVITIEMIERGKYFWYTMSALPSTISFYLLHWITRWYSSQLKHELEVVFQLPHYLHLSRYHVQEQGSWDQQWQSLSPFQSIVYQWTVALKNSEWQGQVHLYLMTWLSHFHSLYLWQILYQPLMHGIYHLRICLFMITEKLRDW